MLASSMIGLQKETGIFTERPHKHGIYTLHANGVQVEVHYQILDNPCSSPFPEESAHPLPMLGAIKSSSSQV